MTILLTSTIWSQAQQINAVPDYVFRNQMSVGRNAVTDTAAYFSIGPRYGATKGFMPPIVGDTATFSSGKRNGLLIFSVQKNKFLYWDSVRVQWSDMAGGSGSYILAGDTAAMLAPYLRKADTTAMLLPYVRHAGYGLTKSGQSFFVDTLNIATRAWRQKGLDSLAALEVSGSGTTNYVAKFTAGSTIGNSQIFDNGTRVGIGTVSPAARLDIRGTGVQDLYLISTTGSNQENTIQSYFNNGGGWSDFSTKSQNLLFYTGPSGGPTTERLRITSGGDVGISQPSLLWTATNRRLLELNGTSQSLIGLNVNSLKAGYIWQNGNDMTIATENAGYIQFGTNGSSDRMRIFSNGRVGINTTTDAGYQLDINGTLRSVNGANFATTSGNVLIGTATASSISTARLSILGSGIQDSYVQVMNGAGGGFLMGSLNGTGMQFYTLTGTQGSESGTKRMEINSNGEILINTSTDAGDYKLQVAGGIYATGNASNSAIQIQSGQAIRSDGSLYMDVGTSGSGIFNLRTGTLGNNAIYAHNNGRVGFNTNVDNGYLVDVFGTFRTTNGANFATSSGNVGIGTTNPIARLDVNGSGIFRDITYIGRDSAANDANVITLRQTAGTDATLGTLYFNTELRPSATGSNRRVDIYAGDNIGYRNINFPYGNIGIGTTSPTQALSIARGAGSIAGISLRGNNNDAANEFFVGQGSAGVAFLAQRASSDLSISTSNVTRLYIFANGRVGINTTTDAGYQLDINGTLRSVNGANFATTSGNVGIGTASPLNKLHVEFSDATAYSPSNTLTSAPIAYFYNNTSADAAVASTIRLDAGNLTGNNAVSLSAVRTGNADAAMTFGTRSGGGSVTERARITSSGELLVNTQSDAGDYKLQVVGNARIGTGKLDIASNTTFGIGVARSGTSEVAGQIYNSNGILYLGAESSAGGQIFSGSSAYAAVIGSGANYPLQFATNNITRATMTTSGNLLLGFTTDSYFLKLQVNGSIFSNNQVLAQGVNAQIAADSSTNVSPLYISNQSLTGSSAQGLFYGSTTWNTTGNPSLIDLNITNTASGATSNYIKISDGSNIFRVTKAAEVVTAAPTGGSIRKWKLGEAATVSPTSPNRTIRVEIDGTVYYLHAKTTND